MRCSRKMVGLKKIIMVMAIMIAGMEMKATIIMIMVVLKIIGDK